MLEQYENLFKEIVWPSGPTSVHFEVGKPPSEDLISNINAVPVTTEGQWVVIQLAHGDWEIPGGTVEVDEDPLSALQRELMEEAGAQIVSEKYIGAWQMHSHAEKPYRPHLPHPVTYRAVYLCEVRLVSPPQIPETDGENVIAVKALNLAEAAKCFEDIDRYDLAELYLFAAAHH